MLAKRIIPCLDIRDGRVVKGVKFLKVRDAGDPVEAARRYDRQGADELAFLDITASHEGRKTLVEVVRRTAAEIYMPLTVGGGISSVEDIRKLLAAGADKVSLNTGAVIRPRLLAESARFFGRQCVVLAIDARRVSQGRWKVYTHGGRQPTELDAIEWARRGTALGAGEILLTSMDADGTKTGYDIGLTRAVSAAVNVPIIASGGAGKLRDIADVLKRGKADAALAASVFHYGKYSVRRVKRYLSSRGIRVRQD